ncbi:hypothetical protein AB0J21_10780 [Streptomyces sp. NPDC049954]|uniref:hypothetical protein n=1 Tax=Streptomyces sp. NPDC049954 TaxID=3155779 RepID=UPI003415FE02
MPAVRRSWAWAGCAAALILLCPTQASAVLGDDKGDEHVSGTADDSGKLSATAAGAGVVIDRSRNGRGQGAGPVAAASEWEPPACYYAPKYTPDELQKYLEPIWAVDSTSPEWDATQRKRYVEGGEYKDFNKAKAGDGFFWDSFVTPGREGDPDALSCDKPIFWVDTGDPPPADAPQAVTPEVLAQLAYAEIRVPSTTVELAPAAESKVNLPTWAWLDGARFEPVAVTASVPRLGIQATTVAEPVSLRIEPGTDDARSLPASGICPITDGHIGEPYAPGKADRTPPCGVTYLRSSHGGSYPLRATLTWKIHWTGTGIAQPQNLPDGEFGAAQDVVVREVQAVNR